MPRMMAPVSSLRSPAFLLSGRGSQFFDALFRDFALLAQRWNWKTQGAAPKWCSKRSGCFAVSCIVVDADGRPRKLDLLRTMKGDHG
jgi:hypothetical protein